MDPWVWAIALKPFFMLALFAGIVIPLELGLQRVIPNSSLKVVLFDRTFADRKPGKYMLVWLGLMIVLWTFIGLLIHRGG
jgi:hypothetical protein